MRKMTYRDYLDKVYGCWLGKCIAGNIGAPYEGMKQRLSLRFDPVYLEKMLPNDDLDLQVLWLEVLEQKGLNLDSDDLADIFYTRCQYAPGEYAYFRKNYEAGIHPPLSGVYNNDVYRDGMGCMIRSEIWACVAPGNPALAAELAARDAVLDHCGDAVYAEQFMAAMESAAFFERDVKKLIRLALAFVPEASRFHRLVEDVLSWCESDRNPDLVWSKILRYYGSAEATTVYHNTGFILAGLLLPSESFLDMTMKICNFGFDTDCTCATAGALYGILAGAEQILGSYAFSEVTYALGVEATRRSDRVLDLAEDVARVGVSLAARTGIAIEDFPGETISFAEERRRLRFAVVYDGDPAIGFGETKKIALKVKNRTRSACTADLRVKSGDALEIRGIPEQITLKGEEEKTFELIVRVRENVERLPMKNGIELTAETESGTESYRFGLVGKYRWRLYGPFWKNNVTVPDLMPGESYWRYFPASSLDEQMDAIRFYHTNCLAEEVPYTPAFYAKGGNPASENEAERGWVFQTGQDAFLLENFAPFDGQASYAAVLKFYAEKERTCGIQVGFSNAVRFFLNGEELIRSDHPMRFTPENAHRFSVPLPAGENTIVVFLKKEGDATRFGFNFLEESACSPHVTDFFIVK